MRNKHFPDQLIEWYRSYLDRQQVKATYKGVTLERAITKGTPQGGVLSPLAWNLAFDSFLDLFTTGPVKVCGFADDAGLVITGIDPHTMRNLMQRTIV